MKAQVGQRFKEGDMVHVVFVEGYGWFVSEQAFKEICKEIEVGEGVDGIEGLKMTVSEYLPYEYHEPKLEGQDEQGKRQGQKGNEEAQETKIIDEVVSEAKNERQ